MRKLLIVLLALLTATAVGCKKSVDETQIVDIGGAVPVSQGGAEGQGTVNVPVTVETPVTPKPRVERAGDGEAAGNALAYGVAPQACVDDAVAYIFDKGEGRFVLYAAIEYTSTGDCPAVVDKASVAFTAGGKSYSVEFTPPLGEHGPVLPGEVSYLAVWHTVTDETLTADAEISVSATLACVKGVAERVNISGSGLYLAQNYPKFATLTGKLTSDSATPTQINMVYCAFYDADGKLLGVWYFTKNAQISNEDSKVFSVHMRELPIPELAERAAEMRISGFGMQ